MPAGRRTRVGRLTKRPDYLRVAAARRKWVTPGMVVQARARDEPGEAGSQHAPDPAPDRDADTPPAPAAAASSSSGPTAPAPSAAPPRVGITVSRKVGNAVQRNRARRRLRAAAREVLPEVGVPATDYVLIGRAGTLTRSYDALLGDLKQAVAKLHRSGSTGGPVARGRGGAPAASGRRRRGKRGGAKDRG